MPDIDVTEVLLDAVVAAEPFSVVRRQEVVSAAGVVTTQDVVVEDLLGSIFPSGDSSLLREEALQTQEQAITVVTTFLLRGAGADTGGASYQPDVVLWKGGTYQVRVVRSYSQYGAGMVEAECLGTAYRGLAPTPALPLEDLSQPQDSQMEPLI